MDMGRLISTSLLLVCMTTASALAAVPDAARIAPPPPWKKDVGVNGLVPARDPNWAASEGNTGIWSPNIAGYEQCQAKGKDIMRQLKMIQSDWKTLTRFDREYPEHIAGGLSSNSDRKVVANNAKSTLERFRAWQDYRCVELYKQVTAEPIDTSRSTTYTNNIYLQGFTPYGSMEGLRGLPDGIDANGQPYKKAAQKGDPVNPAEGITPAGVWTVTSTNGERYTLTLCDSDKKLSGVIADGKGGSAAVTGSYVPGTMRVDFTHAGSAKAIGLTYYADGFFGQDRSTGATWTGERPRLSGLTPPTPASCAAGPFSTNANPMMLVGNWRITADANKQYDMTIALPQAWLPGMPAQIQAPLMSESGAFEGMVVGTLDLNQGVFQFVYTANSGEVANGVMHLGSDASILTVSGNLTVGGATSPLNWTVKRRT